MIEWLDPSKGKWDSPIDESIIMCKDDANQMGECSGKQICPGAENVVCFNLNTKEGEDLLPTCRPCDPQIAPWVTVESGPTREGVCMCIGNPVSLITHNYRVIFLLLAIFYFGRHILYHFGILRRGPGRPRLL